MTCPSSFLRAVPQTTGDEKLIPKVNLQKKKSTDVSFSRWELGSKPISALISSGPFGVTSLTPPAGFAFAFAFAFALLFVLAVRPAGASPGSQEQWRQGLKQIRSVLHGFAIEKK